MRQIESSLRRQLADDDDRLMLATAQIGTHARRRHYFERKRHPGTSMVVVVDIGVRNQLDHDRREPNP